MLGASAIAIRRGREEPVMAAGRGMRMSLPVTLDLIVVAVIIAMIISMNVRLHDLMIIRATIFRAILRADQHRGEPGHRDGRQCEQCRFPKLQAHVLSSFRVERHILGLHATAGNGASLAVCVGASLRAAAPKVPIQADVS
jgi:hypothetical protein